MKSFLCCFAGYNASYQRKEHLQRHLAQHALNGRKVPCPFRDLNDSKPRHKVQYYTQRYFQYFHPQWPFLHPSTYNVENEPPLLVYSVVAIGLWVDVTAASRVAALTLHAKLGYYIAKHQVCFTIPSCLSSICPVATYQAIILHLIFAVQRILHAPLSGTHYDVLLALVEVCRRQHVFLYLKMVQRYRGIASTACVWVGVEEIKRLGMAPRSVCELYKHSFTGYVNARELVTWADLHFPVPDSDELWNAKSNEFLAQRLAELKADPSLDGRCEEDWNSNLDRQTSCA
ncbi:hypothetical protein BDV19DRAFT_397702 [Aspergillus venezuelensis]